MRQMLAILVAALTYGVVVADSCGDYDPLAVDATQLPFKDCVVDDASRSRAIPIRVYLPLGKKNAPVILFSHGLGGNRAGSAYLGEHWGRRGYVVVFVQHPGSDDSVWKNIPIADRKAALKQASGLTSFKARVRDIPAVLNFLEAWNKETGHPFQARLDLKRVGMSGHSFGAVTTQAVSGQTFARGVGFTDSRIRAAVMMSPAIPPAGSPQAAFGAVRIPWMLLTGTRDGFPISDQPIKSRREVFPALPPGDKYELVLDGAEHSVFVEQSLRGETGKRNPNHHRAILAVTTAFWDACLLDQANARKWLAADAVGGVLEKADLWQKK